MRIETSCSHHKAQQHVFFGALHLPDSISATNVLWESRVLFMYMGWFAVADNDAAPKQPPKMTSFANVSLSPSLVLPFFLQVGRLSKRRQGGRTTKTRKPRPPAGRGLRNSYLSLRHHRMGLPRAEVEGVRSTRLLVEVVSAGTTRRYRRVRCGFAKFFQLLRIASPLDS